MDLVFCTFASVTFPASLLASLAHKCQFPLTGLAATSMAAGNTNAASSAEIARLLGAAALRDDFNAAVSHVQSGGASGAGDDQDTKLKFYALFKAAGEGTCTTPEPSSFDFVKHAKWCVSSMQRTVRCDSLHDPACGTGALGRGWAT